MTTSPSDLYAFLALHARGRERAIAAPALAERLVVDYAPNHRASNGGGSQLRKLVRRAVEAGFPICGSSRGGRRGYYVPETSVELREGLEELRSRAKGLLLRAARLEQHASRFYREGRLCG